MDPNNSVLQRLWCSCIPPVCLSVQQPLSEKGSFRVNPFSEEGKGGFTLKGKSCFQVFCPF